MSGKAVEDLVIEQLSRAIAVLVTDEGVDVASILLGEGYSEEDIAKVEAFVGVDFSDG